MRVVLPPHVCRSSAARVSSFHRTRVVRLSHAWCVRRIVCAFVWSTFAFLQCLLQGQRDKGTSDHERKVKACTNLSCLHLKINLNPWNFQVEKLRYSCCFCLKIKLNPSHFHRGHISLLTSDFRWIFPWDSGFMLRSVWNRNNLLYSYLRWNFAVKAFLSVSQVSHTSIEYRLCLDWSNGWIHADCRDAIGYAQSISHFKQRSASPFVWLSTVPNKGENRSKKGGNRSLCSLICQ